MLVLFVVLLLVLLKDESLDVEVEGVVELIVPDELVLLGVVDDEEPI